MGKRWGAGIVSILAVAALAPSALAHGGSGEDPFRPFSIRYGSAADALLARTYLRLELVQEGAAEEARAPQDELEAAMKPSSAPREADAALLGRGPAGGPGVAHYAGARPANVPTQRIPRGEHVSTGHAAVEPSLGVSSKGTLFYVGSGGNGTSLVQRSRDQGRTWEALDLLAPGPGDTPTADPLIYLDPATDRLFNFDYTPPCSVVSFSDDEGGGFSEGLACNHADHQTLFAGPAPKAGPRPSGYENVVYYCAIDGGASVAAYGITACSRSLDGGVTYTRTAQPAFVTDYTKQEGGSLGIPGFCYGATGHGRVGPDGTVYVPRGLCGVPMLAISHDEGDTWERVKVSDLGMEIGVSPQRINGQGTFLGIEEHEARVAIDRAGTIYYFWVARDHLPYLAISRDRGKTFGKPLMVAPPGVQEAMLPALAVGDDGRVAFSYLGTTNSPGGPFCARTTTNGCETATGEPPPDYDAYAKTTWDGFIAMTTNATAKDPLFYSVRVNAASDPLSRGYCGGIACEPTHEFHDVQIAPDGTAWASFVDGVTADPETSGNVGIVGHLLGGPPLVGTEDEQRPRISAPHTAPAGSCTQRRRLTITIAPPKRGRIKSARVTINGGAVRVRRRGTRRRAVVDPRRVDGGEALARIVVRTTTGRVITSTRRYRLCS